MWTYDAEASEPRNSIPDETAAERDFHSRTGEDGRRDVSLELELGQLEGAAAPIYARMLDGEIPTGANRDIMAEFFAVAFARSRRARRGYGEGYGQFLQAQVQRTLKDEQSAKALFDATECNEGYVITEEQRAELRSTNFDMSNYKLSIPLEQTLQAFNLVGPIAGHIVEMEWSFVEASDEDFILSDSPLVISKPGLADPQTQVSLPLSPKKMWIGHWDKGAPRIQRLRREHVFAMNRMRASSADRYLYANRRDDALLRFCKKYAGPKPVFEVTGDGLAPMAPVAIRRKP